jgi:hypothetical protein
MPLVPLRSCRLGLVLLIGMGLASCGRETDPGSLGATGGGASLCTRIAGDSTLVFGNEVLRNEDDRRIQLESVRLVEPTALTLAEAWLLPVENNTLLGTQPLPVDNNVWQERKPARGAQLEPGQVMNLALVLDRDASRAEFSDVEVTYELEGSSYTHRLSHSLVVLANEDCSFDAT